MNRKKIIMMFNMSIIFDKRAIIMNRNEPWSTWQNQYYECTPSEDSEYRGYPLSLLKIFAGRSVAKYGHRSR